MREILEAFNLPFIFVSGLYGIPNNTPLLEISNSIKIFRMSEMRTAQEARNLLMNIADSDFLSSELDVKLTDSNPPGCWRIDIMRSVNSGMMRRLVECFNVNFYSSGKIVLTQKT